MKFLYDTFPIISKIWNELFTKSLITHLGVILRPYRLHGHLAGITGFPNGYYITIYDDNPLRKLSPACAGPLTNDHVPLAPKFGSRQILK